MLVDPGDISRAEVQNKLEGFAAQCKTLEDQARELSAPNDLVSGTAQQIFVLVMSFRATGVSQLKTYLLSALELEDTTGAAVAPASAGATTTTVAQQAGPVVGSVEQIMNSLRFLTTSDFMYREVFEVEVARVLTAKSIGGTKVPSSQFIADAEIASALQVNKIVSAMKNTGTLQATHGVALKAVVVMPDNKTLSDGGTYDLAQSEALFFVVTVENQGNMDETGVRVQVEITSATSSQPPVSAKIGTLKAKGTESIEVKGLSATAYGEKATIKVTVGPVPEERYSDNNTLTATVIFKL